MSTHVRSSIFVIDFNEIMQTRYKILIGMYKKKTVRPLATSNSSKISENITLFFGFFFQIFYGDLSRKKVAFVIVSILTNFPSKHIKKDHNIFEWRFAGGSDNDWLG